MAKTIKDKALNYALGKWNPGTVAFDDCEESYKDGAFAVLDIIVNNMGDEYYEDFWLNKLIKELKGE